MKHKTTNEYESQYLLLKAEYQLLDEAKEVLRVILAKKLKLLCTNYPEAPITNVLFTPKEGDYFQAKVLIQKPKRWNPNYRYALTSPCNSLLNYIKQIETFIANL
jgi:hypothetical protein